MCHVKAALSGRALEGSAGTWVSAKPLSAGRMMVAPLGKLCACGGLVAAPHASKGPVLQRPRVLNVPLDPRWLQDLGTGLCCWGAGR